MAQNIPIQVNGIDPNNTNNLILSDNGQSLVDPNDTVTWNIKPNVGVGSFYKIFKDATSADLFDPNKEPAPHGGSGNWRGTISATATGEEDYTIQWYPTGSTTYRTFDPKLKMR